MLGLIGKIVALRPVLAEGWWVVGVLAAANAVLGVAVYLRWVRVLLQPAPEAVQEAMEQGGTGTVRPRSPGSGRTPATSSRSASAAPSSSSVRCSRSCSSGCSGEVRHGGQPAGTPCGQPDVFLTCPPCTATTTA